MQPLIYIFLSFASWGAALYFFFNKSISWAVSIIKQYMWLSFVWSCKCVWLYDNTNAEKLTKVIKNQVLFHLDKSLFPLSVFC
jgi:hypothetical protein